MHRTAVTLSSALPAQPPAEFRIFAAGANATAKGTFLFDAQAARSVMADAAQRGVDLAIDLEHLSLDPKSPNYDPDARGYFRLALRNGELWAVGVTWTSDAAARLGARTQRYISPAFTFDDAMRPTALVNVALVAQPATEGAAPLAASRSGVIAARLPNPMLRRVRATAARLGIAPGQLVRVCLAGILSSQRDDPAKLLTSLVDLLGLPADANADAIRTAIDALLADTASDPAADPLANGGKADPLAAASLSASERAGIAKLGISAGEYRRRMALAVRRVGSAVPAPTADRATLSLQRATAQARARGMTPDQFAEAKRNAVRRA
ncbi:MAG TPA: phage protease [Polyangiaceae bacterium]|jgi:hypothetical protein